MTATFSTHTLNGADGSHAGGVGVRVVNLATGAVLFDVETDDAGRLSHPVDLTGAGASDLYEVSFAIGRYWAGYRGLREAAQLMEEIVFRFKLPDPDSRYHLPVILSPNAASTWWSAPE